MNKTRRGFMKAAVFAIGGAVGAVTAIPLVRYFLFPVGRKLVSAPDVPIDVAAEADLVLGAAPVRLPIIASGVRDAWGTASDIAIGSCWVSKNESGKVTAFSSVCPHLGCSVDFNRASNEFRCPCHNSRFGVNGEKTDDGPAKRGLDPLEVTVQGGRVKVRYQRFRADIDTREPV